MKNTVAAEVAFLSSLSSAPNDADELFYGAKRLGLGHFTAMAYATRREQGYRAWEALEIARSARA